MLILLLLAGTAYVLGFWALAVRRPNIALALVFASAPIQNDISGGGPLRFSIAEINLLLLLPVLLFKRHRFGGVIVLGATISYFLVGLGCTLPNWRPASLVSFTQLVMYLILAVALFGMVPKRVEDYRASLVGFMIAALVIALAATVYRSGYVLGLHKNNAADSVAAGLLIALELLFHTKDKRWKRALLLAVILLAVGLINTLSRGAWLGAAMGTLVIFALRRQFGLMLRVAVGGTLLFAACWSLLPQESKEYAAGLDGELGNLKPRYESRDFALAKFNSSPIIGVGVGLRKEFDATNFVFLTLAETGVVGMLSFVAMEGTLAVFMWRAQRKMRRESFAFSLVVLACALGVGKMSHSMVDHYWVRGTLLSAWAAVGMATRAAYEERRQRRQAKRARRAKRLAALKSREGEQVLGPENLVQTVP